MFYRIADLTFEINGLHSYMEKFAKAYICEEPEAVDCKIDLTADMIARERANEIQESKSIAFPDSYLETLAALRKVAEFLLTKDGFLMHGALIEYQGKGFLFTARSGTGKTTHIRLWQEAFGKENVQIVNGDKPLFRQLDGKFYGYGTPWCGKERYNLNMRTPLCGIVCVHRGEENKIVRTPAEDAFPFLMSQIMVTDSPDFATQMALLGDMLEAVPTYDLYCNMETEAAEVACRELLKNCK